MQGSSRRCTGWECGHHPSPRYRMSRKDSASGHHCHQTRHRTLHRQSLHEEGPCRGHPRVLLTSRPCWTTMGTQDFGEKLINSLSTIELFFFDRNNLVIGIKLYASSRAIRVLDDADITLLRTLYHSDKDTNQPV